MSLNQDLQHVESELRELAERRADDDAVRAVLDYVDEDDPYTEGGIGDQARSLLKRPWLRPRVGLIVGLPEPKEER